MDGSATRCIECGGVVGSLNEDDEGVPCPVCAERLLETLPGIFHSPWGAAPARDGAPEELAGSEVSNDLDQREG